MSEVVMAAIPLEVTRAASAVDSVPAIPKNAEIGDSQPKLPYRCVFIEDIGGTLR